MKRNYSVFLGNVGSCLDRYFRLTENHDIAELYALNSAITLIVRNSNLMESTMKKLFLITLFAGMTLAAFAQTYTIEATSNRPDCIYRKGEKIKLSVLVMKDGKPSTGDYVAYLTRSCSSQEKAEYRITDGTPFVLETSFNQPDWIYLTVRFFDKDWKNVIRVKRGQAGSFGNGIGAVVEPEKFFPGGKEPTDFDEFWKEQLKELGSVPMNEKIIPVRNGNGVAMHRVLLDCAGGRPVTAYMGVPDKKEGKRFPAIVTFHGAGVRDSNYDGTYLLAQKGFLAMDVNAHGIELGRPPQYYQALGNGAMKQYAMQGVEDRSKCYFRGMFLRVVRALEFIKKRPEWDGKNLIVYGHSQGGAQAIVAAALDPAVSLCVADVPALNDHGAGFVKRRSGWPQYYGVNEKGEPVCSFAKNKSEKIANAVGYYDVSFFAKRIRCETHISTAFVDLICPPTSVYCAFNNLTALQKKMRANPSGNHYVMPGWIYLREEGLKRFTGN